MQASIVSEVSLEGILRVQEGQVLATCRGNAIAKVRAKGVSHRGKFTTSIRLINIRAVMYFVKTARPIEAVHVAFFDKNVGNAKRNQRRWNGHDD
jgi:hypothetical protein